MITTNKFCLRLLLETAFFSVPSSVAMLNYARRFCNTVFCQKKLNQQNRASSELRYPFDFIFGNLLVLLTGVVLEESFSHEKYFYPPKQYFFDGDTQNLQEILQVLESETVAFSFKLLPVVFRFQHGIELQKHKFIITTCWHISVLIYFQLSCQ